jgi:hypothetical protein
METEPLAPGAPSPEWTPYEEPLLVTLGRTFAIAAVVGGVLAWAFGNLALWPRNSLLVLWPSLGGHFVELGFLNFLRPRLPRSRVVQVGARFGVWTVGGSALALGVLLTASSLGLSSSRWPAWWFGGLAFIGIELVAHLVLMVRGRPSFYDGRG